MSGSEAGELLGGLDPGHLILLILISLMFAAFTSSLRVYFCGVRISFWFLNVFLFFAPLLLRYPYIPLYLSAAPLPPPDPTIHHPNFTYFPHVPIHVAFAPGPIADEMEMCFDDASSASSWNISVYSLPCPPVWPPGASGGPSGTAHLPSPDVGECSGPSAAPCGGAAAGSASGAAPGQPPAPRHAASQASPAAGQPGLFWPRVLRCFPDSRSPAAIAAAVHEAAKAACVRPHTCNPPSAESTGVSSILPAQDAPNTASAAKAAAELAAGAAAAAAPREAREKYYQRDVAPLEGVCWASVVPGRWWQVEFCWNRWIRQSHAGSSGRVEASHAIGLGPDAAHRIVAPPTGYPVNIFPPAGPVPAMSRPISTSDGLLTVSGRGKDTVLRAAMAGGTDCDTPQGRRPRRATVVIRCDPAFESGGALELAETSMCVYELQMKHVIACFFAETEGGRLPLPASAVAAMAREEGGTQKRKMGSKEGKTQTSDSGHADQLAMESLARPPPPDAKVVVTCGEMSATGPEDSAPPTTPPEDVSPVLLAPFW
eukprot:TRINITY_DN1985_c0_g2_i1.p1 TRINITY_DN1985_c0_g2~~TRINITY_DN1985_c0_g2_i1.p1  ORF type:complete len:542 (+),score=60.83 TRINITY_DN1985_c0_g2_i1:77-1702(+)